MTRWWRDDDDDDRRYKRRRRAGIAAAAVALAGAGAISGAGLGTPPPPTTDVTTPAGAVAVTVDTQPAATEAATTIVVPAASIPQPPATMAVACGKERWDVKTLKDHPSLTGPVADTIDHLDALPRPANPDGPRTPQETAIYTVSGTVTFEKLEADSDMHVVLQAPSGATLIAEFPDPGCTVGADPSYRAQMAAARDNLLAHFPVGSHATVTGVLFFDRPHGQTGVAPNAVELHPALAIR